jgi:YHS domain-containing protein
MPLGRPTIHSIVFSIALATVLVFAGQGTGLAFDEINTTIFGVAIKGYDPVAYHTEGKAVKGKSAFTFNWNDARWYFASAENRDLFSSNPERYAPQYGGY